MPVSREAGEPDAVVSLLKRTYYALNAQLEGYAANGKVNPVTFIFLAKNHFSYQDKTEIEVAAKQDADSSPDELAAKYANAIPADFTVNDDAES